MYLGFDAMSSTSVRVTDQAIKIFDGNGYTRKYPVERLQRRPRHIGAHHSEICPEAMRTAEISSTGQAACPSALSEVSNTPCTRPGLQADSPWSGAC